MSITDEFLDFLYQLTLEMKPTENIEQQGVRILSRVVPVVDAEDGAIFMLDPITDLLYCSAAFQPIENGKAHPAEDAAAWLLRTQDEMLLVGNLDEIPTWNSHPPQWRSALCVKFGAYDELLGVIVFISGRQHAFTDQHLKLVGIIANMLAQSINNADLYKLIRDQAERLGQLLREQQLRNHDKTE